MYSRQQKEIFKQLKDTTQLYKNQTPLDKKLRQAQTLQNLQNKLNEFIFETEKKLSLLPIPPDKIDILTLVKTRFKELLEVQNNKKNALTEFLLDLVEQDMFYENLKKELSEKFLDS